MTAALRRSCEASTGEPLLVDLKLHFLQQWRLVHAMSEGERPIVLRPEYAAGVDHLNRYFATTIGIGKGRPAPRDLIGIDTLAPATSLGAISRPLIVPHAIATYCRGLWAAERAVRFSFVGLNHWGRSNTLRQWHLDRFGIAANVQTIADGASLPDMVAGAARQSGLGTAILFSKRGRSFPQKVWDDDYYRVLATSTFSLCPDGDQIWSYRFFEACLCGSIPIVQSDWPSYAGFRYRRMTDSGDDLVATPQDQAHNFALACERLTAPRDEIDAALGDV